MQAPAALAERYVPVGIYTHGDASSSLVVGMRSQSQAADVIALV